MGTKRIPFNLQEWLKDKSQKVVNSEGKDVRIICWDRKGKFPVIGLIENLTIQQYNEKGEIIYFGDMHWGPDLFLVTPEPELTEFEKSLADIIGYAISAAQVEPDKPTAEFAKGYAETLLTIARKQLKAEGWEYTDPLFKKVCEEKLKQEPIPDGIAKCIQDHWWEMLDDKDAEEKQPEVDLEEEIAGMYQALFGTDVINRKERLYLDTFEALARHFAKWGAEHLRDSTKMIDKSLEEAAEKYSKGIIDRENSFMCKAAFEAGAEWQRLKDKERR